MAAPVVGSLGQAVKSSQRTFYKMSGSGNDFVFFDLHDGPAGVLETPSAIQALSARGTGVGADGVVFLNGKGPHAIGIRYYNSDGSVGELCGNATLCALKLARELEMVSDGEVAIDTDAGVVHARMAGGLPEIDLAPVVEVMTELPTIARQPRESLMGFARAGVPHVVILDEDVQTSDVLGRGSAIRRDRSLRDGANVNFLTREGEDWLIRTYERGVEGETLACGTGAVASAILLTAWGQAESPVGLITRSGTRLEVRPGQTSSGSWSPSLRGPAELVFQGVLRDLAL